MDKKTTLEMIAAISNANGTSGFEDEVVAAIRPYAEGLGEITEDRMRNLYIRRKENNGNRPVVQLDAHSDEVGFMVQAICPNGTLRIIQVGGWVNHNIPAHKVGSQPIRRIYSGSYCQQASAFHDRAGAQSTSGDERYHGGCWCCF